MDNPERQIAGVIQALCTRPIADQQAVIRDYFTPDAYFIHPFCRVPSFSMRALPLDDREFNSRAIIQSIYHWYRILSPQIDLRVESAVFDKKNQLLYATIFQTFTLWFIPFSLWQSKVKLVTVLELARLPVDSKGLPLPGTSHPDDWTQPTRYFIRGQEDHYQVNEFLKFVLPFGASFIWYLWQVLSTVVCVVGVLVFWPVTSFYDYFTRPGGLDGQHRARAPEARDVELGRTNKTKRVHIIEPTPNDYLGPSDEDPDDCVVAHVVSGNKMGKSEPACRWSDMRRHPSSDHPPPDTYIWAPLDFKKPNESMLPSLTLDSKDLSPVSVEIRDRIGLMVLALVQERMYPVNADGAAISQKNIGDAMVDTCGDRAKLPRESDGDTIEAQVSIEQVPEREQTTQPTSPIQFPKRSRDEYALVDMSGEIPTTNTEPCRVISTGAESPLLFPFEDNEPLLSGDDAKQIASPLSLAHKDGDSLSGDTQNGMPQPHGFENKVAEDSQDHEARHASLVAESERFLSDTRSFVAHLQPLGRKEVVSEYA